MRCPGALPGQGNRQEQVQLYHPERRRYLRFELEPGKFEVEVLVVARPRPRRLRVTSAATGFSSPAPRSSGRGGDRDPFGRCRGGGRAEWPCVSAGGWCASRNSRADQAPESVTGEDELAEDRYEIGVAFDLSWGEGIDDLLNSWRRPGTGRSASGLDPHSRNGYDHLVGRAGAGGAGRGRRARPRLIAELGLRVERSHAGRDSGFRRLVARRGRVDPVRTRRIRGNARAGLVHRHSRRAGDVRGLAPWRRTAPAGGRRPRCHGRGPRAGQRERWRFDRRRTWRALRCPVRCRLGACRPASAGLGCCPSTGTGTTASGRRPCSIFAPGTRRSA